MAKKIDRKAVKPRKKYFRNFLLRVGTCNHQATAILHPEEYRKYFRAGMQKEMQLV